MFCSNCGNNLGAEKPKFCGNCGTPTGKSKVAKKKPANDESVEVSEASSSAPEETNTEEVFSEVTETAELSSLQQKLDEIPTRLKIIYGSAIAAVLAIFVGLGFVPGLYAPLNATNMPTMADQFTTEELKKIARSHCTTLNNTVPTAETLAVYEDQIAQIKKVGEGDEGRKMKTFASKATWLAPTSTQSDFTARVEAVISAALTDTVKDVELLGLSDSNRGLMESLWSSAFTTLVKAECDFEGVETETLSTLSTYDNVMSRASSVASNAPWYPKGYYEYSTNLAYKWVTKSYDCWSCWYWHLKVITNVVCPSGIYVEGNIFTGASITDWTNDTVPYLGPGQTATLRLVTYQNARPTNIELTNLRCY
jgi:hypothetical protein